MSVQQSQIQKKSSHPVALTSNSLQSRPFAPAETEQQTPDHLQAQLEHQQQFGHSFANTLKITNPNVQAKLTIGQPNDKYEQEADQVAAQVVQQINAPSQKTAQPQRITGQTLQKKSTIQLSQNGAAVSGDLEQSIEQARGSGQPLHAKTRVAMEQAFGANFRGVRIHTDSASDHLSRSIQAKAFATGQDIFFRKGTYQPESQQGQELIAHELTHVVQQNSGTVQRMSNTIQRDPNEYGNLEKDEESAAYKDVGKTLIAAYRMISEATTALGKGKNREAIKTALIGLVEVGVKVATSLSGIPGVIGIDGSDVVINATTSSVLQQGAKTGVGLGISAIESSPVQQLDRRKKATTTKGAIANKIHAKVGNLENCLKTVASLTGLASLKKIYDGVKLLKSDYDAWNRDKGVLIRNIEDVVVAMSDAVNELDLGNFGDLTVTSANKTLFMLHTRRSLDDIVKKYNEKTQVLIQVINKWDDKHIENRPLLSHGAMQDDD